jgi:hypothetical protein
MLSGSVGHGHRSILSEHAEAPAVFCVSRPLAGKIRKKVGPIVDYLIDVYGGPRVGTLSTERAGKIVLGGSLKVR